VTVAWLALALYLLGLLLAFGWRTLTQWRRTGDTGLRLDAGRPGTLRWWAKPLFLAALMLGFTGPVAALAGLPELPGLNHWPLHVIGLVLAVAGVAVTLAAWLVLVLTLQLQVRAVEEPYLLSVHGTDYGRYAARVGRLLPGVGRISLGDDNTSHA